MTALTERDEVTLAVMAAVEGASTAEQRRRAVADYTGRALAEPCVSLAVEAIMTARRSRQAPTASNVVPLRRKAAR